jgi:hypothetical protein
VTIFGYRIAAQEWGGVDRSFIFDEFKMQMHAGGVTRSTHFADGRTRFYRLTRLHFDAI